MALPPVALPPRPPAPPVAVVRWSLALVWSWVWAPPVSVFAPVVVSWLPLLPPVAVLSAVAAALSMVMEGVEPEPEPPPVRPMT